jgi:hypothetical protein
LTLQCDFAVALMRDLSRSHQSAILGLDCAQGVEHVIEASNRVKVRFAALYQSALQGLSCIECRQIKNGSYTLFLANHGIEAQVSCLQFQFEANTFR